MSGLQKNILTAVFALGALLACLRPESAVASDGANGQRNVLSQGFGVRALSLGGAYVSLANDADATFWNPAGLTALERQTFGATHSRFFEGTEISSATWGHNFDNLGAFGASFTRLGLDGFPAVQNWVVSPQDITFTTSLTTVSYARSFGTYLSAGVTGKALYESLFDSQDYGFGLDVGLAVQRDKLRAGILIRDIGSTDIKIGADGEDQPLSSQFGLALDSLRIAEQLSVSASAEIELIESRSAIGHAGAEALIHNTLALRGGVDDGDATFGAGFVVDDFRFDYGYRVMSDIGDTHLFGLSFLFGSTSEQRKQKRLAEVTQQGEAYAGADRKKRAAKAAQKATVFESAGELDSAIVYLQLAHSLDSGAVDVTARITTIQQALAEQAKKDSLAIVESAGLDSLSMAELASQLAVGLAEELRAEKRYASALRVLNKALVSDPDSPDLAVAVSRITKDRDLWKTAQKAAAKKARAAGEYQKALDMYAELAREFPHDPQVRSALRSISSKLKISDLLSRAGRKMDSELYNDAKTYVERALTIDSSNVVAKGLMSRILLAITPDESIRAISDNPEDWAQMSQALSLVREGKLEEALRLFDGLLEKYPHNTELLRNKEQVELRLSGAKAKKRK